MKFKFKTISPKNEENVEIYNRNIENSDLRIWRRTLNWGLGVFRWLFTTKAGIGTIVFTGVGVALNSLVGFLISLRGKTHHASERTNDISNALRKKMKDLEMEIEKLKKQRLEIQKGMGPPGPPGPQGDEGKRGPEGPPGPQGDEGPSGKRGPEGPPGPQGDEGPSGKRGPPGDEGKRGPEGPPGPSGDEGPPGPPGDEGPSGKKGDEGPPGKPGEDGYRGEKGVQGKTGHPGDKGDKGERGTQGKTGHPGDKGDKGNIQQAQALGGGFNGNKGPPGDRGPPGPPGGGGDKGDGGDRGPPGYKGDKGDGGDKGDKGDGGDKGDKGDRGYKGDGGGGYKGYKGDKGDRGDGGDKGDKGDKGPHRLSPVDNDDRTGWLAFLWLKMESIVRALWNNPRKTIGALFLWTQNFVSTELLEFERQALRAGSELMKLTAKGFRLTSEHLIAVFLVVTVLFVLILYRTW